MTHASSVCSDVVYASYLYKVSGPHSNKVKDRVVVNVARQMAQIWWPVIMCNGLDDDNAELTINHTPRSRIFSTKLFLVTPL